MVLTERIERIIAWWTGNDGVHLTPAGWVALASVLAIVIAAIALAAKNR